MWTRALILVLLYALPGASHAATINAASTSRADVGTAIDAASNGDTVVIPAGTSTWTTSLPLTKGITLQGAGIGQTIIRDNIASGYIINCTLVEDQVTRITGIEFNDNGAAADWRFRFSGTSTDDRRIRVDNCKFDSLSGPVFLFYTCLGVVDHNIIIGKASGVPAFMGHVINSSWGYAVDAPKWGDGAWTEGDQFGTEKFLFFENNNITNLYAASALTMLDGHSGTRYVFRNNNVHKGSMEIHGAEAARTRSGRAYEIYGNTFVSDDSRSSPVYMRGGVGLVYNNTFNGWTVNAVFSLLDNRMLNHIFSPVQGADGRNPFDKNDAGSPFDSFTLTGVGTLTATDSGAMWMTDEHVGRTLRRTSGKTVSSLTRSGSTVTVTSTGHGFTTGNLVTVWGANQYAFNGIRSITRISDDVFTFTSDFLPSETTGTGTILCALGGNFALIVDNTSTELTLADAVSGTTYRMTLAPGDTCEINAVTQTMDQIGVSGGTDLGGVNVPEVWTNTQTVSPWYEWNNLREGGADVNFSATFASGTYPTIQINVHYFNNTQKPGYTAYTYPHPLIALTGGGFGPRVVHGGSRVEISGRVESQ